ncbi:diguanylate cyclase [Aurantivibrio plasticivorans]
MNYAFTDIFDIPRLTKLCESYTQTNGVVTALLDLEGNVHVKSGWQDICTQFHRVHPVSSKRCTESDTVLAEQLSEGQQYNVYCCKNGLVDVAVPVIIDGEHVANFFTGQFFFEPPDQNRFIKQGKELGFDLIPYVDALQKVPTFREQDIKKIMAFLVNLAQIIGEMGKAKLELLELRKEDQKTLNQLQQARHQLEKQASEDPLTGLYNRRKFAKRLNEEFSRATRYHHSLTIAMIDIDFFKVVNDTLGHNAGDQVIIKIAESLKRCVRHSDIVARLGGDEFCVIFPEMDQQDALPVLHKIRESVEDMSLERSPNIDHVTCSIGLAHMTPDIATADDLLINADKALYQSKNQGRNRTTAYIQYAAGKPS